MYSETVKEESAVDIESTLPIHRNRSNRVDDGQDAHMFESLKQLHIQEDIETLEFLIIQLEERFNQNDFNIVCDMEKMLLETTVGPLSQSQIQSSCTAKTLTRLNWKHKLNSFRNSSRLPMRASKMYGQ